MNNWEKRIVEGVVGPTLWIYPANVKIRKEQTCNLVTVSVNNIAKNQTLELQQFTAFVANAKQNLAYVYLHMYIIINKL